MSHLRAGDEEMHYSDGSHRWVPPPGRDQTSWEERVREHQRQHQQELGASSATPGPAGGEARPLRIPRQRYHGAVA